ncbi:hypothetical protein LSH36_1471g00003 [Paralvinella palmiformis]|uniref:Uncharacterized protein n=1 Tax=Paralvinella palmiformis TaxID=53620 RepID=A0AAD9MN10_9ANNE|nr:hypothetical protein LSH36_1471g00003 [Paralvinella palmiformis]
MLKSLIIVILIGVGLYFISKYSNGCSYNPDLRIDNKVVILTGGNTGIGKETVKDLVKRGAKVYMGCRSLEKAQKAIDDIKKETGVSDDNVVLLHLDLTSLSSIREFVDEFKKREYQLDILINNAGIMFAPYNITVDGFEQTIASNYLGHFLLTHLLADILLASAPSRIVTLSSLGHLFGTIDFDDFMGEKNKDWPFFHKGYAYPQSKLANILLAKELARRLDDTGVTSYAVHPGTVNTDLYRYSLPFQVAMFLASPFIKDTYHGARTSIYCAIEPGLEKNSGEYFSDCAATQPSAEARDVNVAKRLWDMSIDLVKLQPDEIHPKLR